MAATPVPQTGSAAVDQAVNANAQAGANAPAPVPTMLMTATSVAAKVPGGSGGSAEKDEGRAQEPLKQVGNRTFVFRDKTWVDTQYDPAKMKATAITFLSDEYFALLDKYPDLKDALALGDHVIVVVDGAAYEVKPG